MGNYFPFDSINGDRKINAKDFATLFESYYQNGVFPADGMSNNQCFPISTDGMNVIVGTGRANINGHFFYSDSETTMTLESDSTTKTVNIFLRYSATNRNIEIIQTTESRKTTADVYDLVLATVNVKASASSISDSDVTSNVGTNECPYVVSEIWKIDSILTELKKQKNIPLAKLYSSSDSATTKIIANNYTVGEVTEHTTNIVFDSEINTSDNYFKIITENSAKRIQVLKAGNYRVTARFETDVESVSTDKERIEICYGNVSTFNGVKAYSQCNSGCNSLSIDTVLTLNENDYVFLRHNYLALGNKGGKSYSVYHGSKIGELTIQTLESEAL